MTKSPINVNIVPDLPDSTKEEVLNPSANLLGQAFRGIAHKVLDPLVRYNIVKDSEMDDFSEKIRGKTSDIPLEHRDSEKIGLTFKAVEDSAYQLNSEELREMFSTLIAASVDSRINNHIHPSFSTILKDLSTKDARLFKSLYKHKSVPSVTVRASNSDKSSGLDLVENVLILGSDYIIEPVSLTNLERFGLISIFKDSYLTSEENMEIYNNFERSNVFQEYQNKLPLELNNFTATDVAVDKGYVTTTALGREFGNITIL